MTTPPVGERSAKRSRRTSLRAVPAQVEPTGVVPGLAPMVQQTLDQNAVVDAGEATVTPPVRRPAAVLPGRRRLRRHRTGAPMPALLPVADIPEDAEGRVMFIAITPLPDVVPGVDEVDELDADEVAEATEPLGPLGAAIGAVTRRPFQLFMRGGLAGWAPVLLLAVVFVVVFVVGMHIAK